MGDAMPITSHQVMTVGTTGRLRGTRYGALLCLAIGATLALMAARSAGIAHAEVPPTVVTEPATEIGEDTTTLHGKVTFGGSSIEYYFEYGLEAGKYEHRTRTEDANAPEGYVLRASETLDSFNGLLPDTPYHFRIVAHDNAGTSYGKDAISATWTFASKFGSEGTGNGQLKGPRGVAVDSKGDLWVADSGNGRVQEFSSSDGYLRTCGSPFLSEYPYGIAIDSEGKVWVVDSKNLRLVKYSSACSLEAEDDFSKGSGNGQFGYPTGIAIDSKRNLWIADSSNERVEEFSTTGKYLGQISGSSLLSGEPLGIAIDPASHDIVVACKDGYVDVFNSSGESIRWIHTGGEPYGVTVTPSGHVLLSQAGPYQEIEEYTLTGELITWFGNKGTGNGDFELPAFMAMDGETALVADSGNSRIQEFTSPND